ncbi:MAG: endonuclease III [Candidatus Egerieousia sp.]
MIADYKKHILDWFEKNSADAESELTFGNPFELIVAVILSAQCTDKRVNMVTPGLLEKYSDAQALANADREELYDCIKSISFPNSKTDHLIGMAKMLVSDFNGEVPSEIDELVKLPGVGRKTANVVASICFDKPVIAVDTHVFRVAHRMGFSKGATPLDVERDLEKLIPLKKRGKAHHWLILHGRYVCKSLKPKCESCGVAQWCPKLLDGSKLRKA